MPYHHRWSAFVRAASLAAAGLLLASAPGLAAYPERTITLVIPFAAGGGADLDARLAQPALEKALGVSIRIVNMPGAGGVEGTRFVYEAAPDGYTIGYGTFGSFLGPYLLDNEVGYEPLEFSGLTKLTDTAMLVVSPPDAPWQDLAGLVDYVHQNPGKVPYTLVGGTQGTSAYPMFAFTEAANLDWRGVSYKGSSDALRAVMGGEALFHTASLNSTAPLVADGKVRALAVLSKERIPGIDAPSFTELGYDVSFSVWRAAYAPPNLAADIEAKLVEAWRAVANDPEFLAAMEKNQQEVTFEAPEIFTASIAAQIEALRPVAEKMAAAK